MCCLPAFLSHPLSFRCLVRHYHSLFFFQSVVRCTSLHSPFILFCPSGLFFIRFLSAFVRLHVFYELIEKNEERFELAEKVENPMSTRENCEHLLGNVTSWQNTYKMRDKIDEFLVSAKGYNCIVQEKQTPVVQTKSHHSKSDISSISSSTSSQCKQYLVLATVKKGL